MNKTRLENLSDGIFAIVMTLLVIEIKVPELHSEFSEAGLWHDLQKLTPLFLSFFLSFAVLITYWNSHNFMISDFAKNLNRHLINLNMAFLAFICLIPFSSHMLGSYPGSKVAIAVYSFNVLIIALLLLAIREYISGSKTIENSSFTPIDRLYGTTRIIIAAGGSIAALIFSSVSTTISIILLIIPVIINLIPGMIGLVTRVTGLDKSAKAASLENN